MTSKPPDRPCGALTGMVLIAGISSGVVVGIAVAAFLWARRWGHR